ncbi:MAG: hypothetical protein D9N14_12250 [Ketobacter sp.]|nr:MAG: hypothetical protein D9N14_12250 [Ketobacter sp.]
MVHIALVSGIHMHRRLTGMQALLDNPVSAATGHRQQAENQQTYDQALTGADIPIHEPIQETTFLCSQVYLGKPGYAALPLVM